MTFRGRVFWLWMLGIALAGVAGHLILDGAAQGVKGKRGGRLVISKSRVPRSLNRLFASDDPTTSITNCMSGSLIRINRVSQQPEPDVAQSWKVSPDGKRITFTLRPGLKFSDGRPATVDDVVFSFQLINDPKVNAPASDQFNFEGQRVRVEKVDAATIAFVFPTPRAAAIRLFDGIPILPRHILESAYRAGRIEQAWSLSTPPDQIVGLGPFRLKSYVPDQRVILQRNDYYWKTSSSGERLPFLDELVFSIDRERNAQLLKFQQGETDLLSPVNAEELSSLAAIERQGRIKIHDLGPSLIREILWFNLNESKLASGRSAVDPVKLSWFKDIRFRQAISHAIDRQSIVKLVFAGRAAPQWGFVSVGDRLWFNSSVAKYPLDTSRSLQLLREAGFTYRADQKLLVDSQGRPVTFTLLTNVNPLRQKVTALLQNDFAKIGIRVSLATLESGSLLSRVNESFDYESCLLAIVSGDSDPSSQSNVLLSGGAQHWWQPNQVKPATSWEARIDELMRQQMTTVNTAARKRLFDEVQRIMAEQQPFIFLVARNLMISAKTNIGNLRPAQLPDFVLWNCEELFRG
ncbi:MAG: ABC transporter substrate-binding protein [Acidobacteriota bacterium]